MTNTTLGYSIEFPTLPSGYSWSVTDYLGFPDGDPKDPATRKGQRVLVAIHHNYRFAFVRFTVRVGRVAAYILNAHTRPEYAQETVDEIYRSFQRRQAQV